MAIKMKGMKKVGHKAKKVKKTSAKTNVGQKLFSVLSPNQLDDLVQELKNGLYDLDRKDLKKVPKNVLKTLRKEYADLVQEKRVLIKRDFPVEFDVWFSWQDNQVSVEYDAKEPDVFDLNKKELLKIDASVKKTHDDFIAQGRKLNKQIKEIAKTYGLTQTLLREAIEE